MDEAPLFHPRRGSPRLILSRDQFTRRFRHCVLSIAISDFQLFVILIEKVFFVGKRIYVILQRLPIFQCVSKTTVEIDD